MNLNNTNLLKRNCYETLNSSRLLFLYPLSQVVQIMLYMLQTYRPSKIMGIFYYWFFFSKKGIKQLLPFPLAPNSNTIQGQTVDFYKN